MVIFSLCLWKFQIHWMFYESLKFPFNFVNFKSHFHTKFLESTIKHPTNETCQNLYLLESSGRTSGLQAWEIGSLPASTSMLIQNMTKIIVRSFILTVDVSLMVAWPLNNSADADCCEWWEDPFTFSILTRHCLWYFLYPRQEHHCQEISLLAQLMLVCSFPWVK